VRSSQPPKSILLQVLPKLQSQSPGGKRTNPASKQDSRIEDMLREIDHLMRG
jgi:hypothetical protein